MTTALDKQVAALDGLELDTNNIPIKFKGVLIQYVYPSDKVAYNPSTDPMMVWDIMERQKIGVVWDLKAKTWAAATADQKFKGTSTTNPRIAALKAFVASKGAMPVEDDVVVPPTPPVITPSPDGTEGVKVTDDAGKVYTLGGLRANDPYNKQVIVDGKTTTSYVEKYLYFKKIVYGKTNTGSGYVWYNLTAGGVVPKDPRT